MTSIQTQTPTRITVMEGEPSGDDFFGKDGLSFGDVLDAINPLNQIPFVRNLFGSEADQPSTASKIAGSAIFGGPIGLVAGLANAIFEQATGKDIGATVVAALTGDAAEAPVQVASAAPVAVEAAAPLVVADAARAVSVTTGSQNRDAALLELYGQSAPSAHSAYQKAKLLPYLSQVTVSSKV